MSRYGARVFVPVPAGLHLAAMCRREARNIGLIQDGCRRAGGIIDKEAMALASALESVAEQLTDSLEEPEQ